MNTETEVLAAAIVKEAKGNQLKLSDIHNGVVTAQIIAIGANFPKGSVHVFAMMAGAFSTVSGQISFTPQVIELTLPKNFFEENLAEAEVKLLYIVITAEGKIVPSSVLELHVVE